MELRAMERWMYVLNSKATVSEMHPWKATSLHDYPSQLVQVSPLTCPLDAGKDDANMRSMMLLMEQDGKVSPSISHSPWLLCLLLGWRSWNQLGKLGTLNKLGIWSSEWHLFIHCPSWRGTGTTQNHSFRRAHRLPLWGRQPLGILLWSC